MMNEQLVTLTADIVASHVANNRVGIDEIAGLVHGVHSALASLGQEQESAEPKVPVVSVRASIKPDRLICMECGTPHKMLKRHLMTAHSMTPDEYRKDYGLNGDYPMVAAEYAEKRRELAKSIGLGRKPDQKRGRKPKAAQNSEGAGGAEGK